MRLPEPRALLFRFRLSVSRQPSGNSSVLGQHIIFLPLTQRQSSAQDRGDPQYGPIHIVLVPQLGLQFRQAILIGTRSGPSPGATLPLWRPPRRALRGARGALRRGYDFRSNPRGAPRRFGNPRLAHPRFGPHRLSARHRSPVKAEGYRSTTVPPLTRMTSNRTLQSLYSRCRERKILAVSTILRRLSGPIALASSSGPMLSQDFTSVKAITPPRRAIISISPPFQRRFRATIDQPSASRKDAATSSPARPLADDERTGRAGSSAPASPRGLAGRRLTNRRRLVGRPLASRCRHVGRRAPWDRGPGR